MKSDLLYISRRRRAELYSDRGSQQGAKRAVQNESFEDRRRVSRAALQASGLGGCQNDVLAAGCWKGNLPSRGRILIHESSKTGDGEHLAFGFYVLAGMNEDCLVRVME